MVALSRLLLLLLLEENTASIFSSSLHSCKRKSYFMWRLLKEMCSPAWELVSITSRREVLCLSAVNKGQAGFGSCMYYLEARSLVFTILVGN